jgi:predicted nucleic acid-binding protein
VIVLDASVLIAHLDGRDRHHAEAETLLKESSSEPLGASAITLAETLVFPARTGRLTDAEAALQRLGVAELTLGENTSGRLAKLRAEANLKMPDCCVLLAAEEHKGIVASFDSDLLAAARKLGLKTAG